MKEQIRKKMEDSEKKAKGHEFKRHFPSFAAQVFGGLAPFFVLFRSNIVLKVDMYFLSFLALRVAEVASMLQIILEVVSLVRVTWGEVA